MAKVKRSVKTIPSRIHPVTADDEIVISGISGRFPSAKNVTEFAHNLYNKVWTLEYENEFESRTSTELFS